MLVLLRPFKQVYLSKIRELFETCTLPGQSAEWVESIRQSKVERPPYRKIVETIDTLQKKYAKTPVKYSMLLNELTHLDPPIAYPRESKIKEICEMMASLAPDVIWAHPARVELEQSVENAMADIEAATQEYSYDEQLR